MIAEVDRDREVARLIAELRNDNRELKLKADQLERENRDLHARLRIAEQHIPIEAHRSYRIALGEEGGW